jgi:hypothetical protein
MLLDYLSKIRDPRRSQGRRYQLNHILLFSILAILSGAKSYRDVARFFKKRYKQLNKLFKLKWKKSLSKSQLRDILCAIEINSIEACFRDYSRKLSELDLVGKTNQVGLDGKSLRGSFAFEKGQNMLQLLGAFCSKCALILGHVDISEKTNEIPTAQKLIAELELPDGTIYTADALHCQKKLLLKQKKLNLN